MTVTLAARVIMTWTTFAMLSNLLSLAEPTALLLAQAAAAVHQASWRCVTTSTMMLHSLLQTTMPSTCLA
jgi:hypothetical protein